MRATDTSTFAPSSNKPFGGFAGIGFKNDSQIDQIDKEDENGCLTGLFGLQYNVNKPLRFKNYYANLRYTFQGSIGYEDWENRQISYQFLFMPSWKDFSLPITWTRYNWEEGPSQSVEEIMLLYQF